MIFVNNLDPDPDPEDDHLHAESLSGWLDEDSAGDADDDDGDEGDGESCKEFDHVINHHDTKNTIMMIEFFNLNILLHQRLLATTSSHVQVQSSPSSSQTFN